jgi:Predicted pyridoxal phosphate-dependent enzyme apparently involved in regulation of cell wall biogenesis
MIPFTNLSAHYHVLRDDIDRAISHVLEDGYFILGDQLRNFEEEFARFIGVRYCVGVASGTDAITLCLLASGIQPDDEVITTAMTAFPTITGILQTGARPVVVDITIDDGLIDVSRIVEKITSKTKAIVAVHLYGQCCDMDQLQALARNHGLVIIEDAAQAVGASYKGRKAGSIGQCNAFSFYPTKNLGAFGDGGAVTTDDRLIYESLLSRRNYGQSDRYHHDGPGTNSRLDELQAAILRVKLTHLLEWNNRRASIAQKYRSNLKTVRCLIEHGYGVSNHHLFVVRHGQPERCMSHLETRGVQTLIHYPLPVHRQKAFPFQQNESFPHSELFSKTIFSLPIYPELPDTDVETIIEVLNECTF